MEGIKLQLTASAVERLIKSGALTISDFRCNDNQAKKTIMRLYLEATATMPSKY